jgi:hypothetical protein
MMAENQIRGQLQLAPAGDVPDNNQVMPTVAVFFIQDGIPTNILEFIEDSQTGGVALVGMITDQGEQITALEARIEALETP